MEPGKAFIFQQINFDKGLKLVKREGSERDVTSLQNTLKKFNVESTVFTDFNVKEIAQAAVEISKLDFERSSCIVIAILSHGDESDIIYAKDWKYAIDETILTPLLDNKALRNIPKIFFIQACKGPMRLRHDRPAVAAYPPKYVLKCYATYEGYEAYRLKNSGGSLFIRTLCKHLDASGATKGIRSIMDEVKKESFQPNVNNMVWQIPSVVDTLTEEYVFGEYVR